MSVSLIVTRSLDREFNKTNMTISLEEWLAFVAKDPTLRVMATPPTATNPATGEIISIRLRPGDTEFRASQEFVPFLGYSDGELRMRYLDRFDNPTDPIRRQIAKVAAHFGALIMCDAGDGILDW